MRVGVISTQFLRASQSAFSGEDAIYKKKLVQTCLTKRGHLRATMSSPVAGSMRLVAVNQTRYARDVFCISKTLAETVRFERVTITDGVASRTSEWSTLQEGDYVLLNRPPTLTLRSMQPAVVRFWEHHCAGVHTELFSWMHGDFDGDEIHAVVLGDPRSIEEAKAWIVAPLPEFERARRREREMGIQNEFLPSDVGLDFMRYTTVSATQLMNGDTDLIFGEETRNPTKHMNATTKRFHDRMTESNFVSESIRGTADVCKQQLSQSSIGDLSRTSRIAASCFTRDASGALVCAARDGIIHLDATPTLDRGVPSTRAIIKICSVAQQALLDAHRAGGSSTGGIDLISNMLRGAQTGQEELDKVTLCAFPTGTVGLPKTLWRLEAPRHLLCLLDISDLGPYHYQQCAGSYSPMVLRRIEGHRRVSVCRTGIEYVCMYYDIRLTDVEMTDLSYCMSHKPEASPHPITTREGMMARELSALDTLIATDFTKLPLLVNSTSRPITSTCAMFMSNFSELTRKRTSESG